MVVEDAADPARLLAVRQIEVFVAPGLVLVVVGDGVVSAAGRLHRRMKGDRVGIVLGAAAVQHRRQVRAAAEPRFRRHDEARVHVHGRHMRIAHVGDDRNAGRPEARVFGCARHLRAKLRRELAMHGRAVHADLLEQPSVHHRHDAAAALGAGVIGPLPGRALEAARLAGIERGRRVALERLERRANLVAQRFEPRAGAGFLVLDIGGSVMNGVCISFAAPVCLNASPSAIAAAIATLSERMPGLHRDRQPLVGGGEHLVRHAGRLAPQQQNVGRAVAAIQIGLAALGGQQQQPDAGLAAPVFERVARTT